VTSNSTGAADTINWVLNRTAPGLTLAAHVEEPVSGRVLELLTSEPGVQFCTANSLASMPGKGWVSYERRSGFCFETQHFPRFSESTEISLHGTEARRCVPQYDRIPFSHEIRASGTGRHRVCNGSNAVFAPSFKV